MGGKSPPCSWRKGPGGIPPTVSLAWLEDALEKLHFYVPGSHCKEGELLQFPGTEFRARPVEQILSVCLIFLKR